MKTGYRFAVGVLSAVALFVVAPATGSGQGFKPCDECGLGPTGYHDFGHAGFTVTCEGWGEDSDDACHTYSLSGHCTGVHYETCGTLPDLALKVENTAKTLAMRQGIAAAMREFPALRFNKERNALQLLNCTGTSVVVHVPLEAGDRAARSRSTD